MLDCEGSFNSVEPIRSLSEMEPSGVSVEVTKSCTSKDHCQSVGVESVADLFADPGSKVIHHDHTLPNSKTRKNGECSPVLPGAPRVLRSSLTGSPASVGSSPPAPVAFDHPDRSISSVAPRSVPFPALKQSREPLRFPNCAYLNVDSINPTQYPKRAACSARLVRSRARTLASKKWGGIQPCMRRLCGR